MTKEQIEEADECITHIREGLESGVSELNRSFAFVALDRLKAVAAGEAPITLVVANEVALGQMARALRGALNVPGVRAVSSRVTSTKAPA